MGLFDKLFGASGNDVLNKLKDVAENVAKEAEGVINSAANSIANSTSQSASANANPAGTGTATANTSAAAASSYAESGFSWGPEMPNEPNQFNYPGTYDAYFSAVFAEAFPEYRVSKESVRKGRATVFTLWNGDAKALVVEVMAQTSSAESIRYGCAKEHVPYLRFYYNHPGWWNTKAYVIQRARKALGL